ncbi:helix-turn-helix domain-containing protein [Photobacterium lucens]|uniref:helix-turn-helix domain-containing protein n=1 Tax=Photobacterium lucens TaxID=2562949 RepID=UPI00137025EE|nr:helix-turn-helix domain-containing protein [Photobacterium lucens]MZG57001.1 helix-turn-helix domain-containing protein [Photobacterium lucens]MZG81829.1 helix-turn-helix domain-containing protein [Photobacterium lucens]
MNEDIFKARISKHLKALREKQKLSLDAASKLTGVSKAMLGQIERKESSPTVATLWKISSGLNSSFTAFFSDLNDTDGKIFPADIDIHVKTLIAYDPTVNFEMFEITLTRFHTQCSSPHKVGTIEHSVVIDGELGVHVDGEWHYLSKGETIRFEADKPHDYRAVTETVVFHNIVSYSAVMHVNE